MTVAGEDPRIVRSRALILDAAGACFAENGYEETSIDDIAHRAGVAKRTVYNIYADKETVFRAALDRSIAIAESFSQQAVSDVGGLDDPDRELPAIGVRLARDVLLGRVVPLRRLVASEAARFPDIARQYRERAPEAVLRALAEGFSALARRGLLEIDDAALAAEHFAFLVMGAELDRRMFGDDRHATTEIEARATAGARTFLRAYRPRD